MSTGTAPVRSRSQSQVGGPQPQTRLRWWGLLLPVVAFALLLALLSAGDTHAAAAEQQAAWQPVVDLLRRIGHALAAG